MMTRFVLIVAIAFAASAVDAAEGAECPVDRHACAGQPQCVHRFAIPSKTPRYCGGLIGGGAALGGGDPYVHEGTWGWDYTGFLTKRVFLNWSHHHHEAGGGKYDTDRRKEH